MGTAHADSHPLMRIEVEGNAAQGWATPVQASSPASISARLVHTIEAVEDVWRDLTVGGVESPGQSYDFIRLWVEDRKIAESDQSFVVGEVDGVPVALLPLHRRTIFGLKVFTWFPSSQVGCYAPISDYAQLAALGAEGRQVLWQAMMAQLEGADAVYLRAMPAEVSTYGALFDELGTSLPVDVLYRSVFGSFEECDKVQRSRSRRKHDRQQGDRLNAMGDVAFELVSDPERGAEIIDTMFQQRSARFRAQGIRDTFVCDNLIPFYRRAMQPGSGLDIRLHVLRLNGDIVAVRYNVVHGDRMFCLISSMSDDPAIQAGSPGKQCLLQVMQTVFDDGFSMFDMGSGFTDEKRHWCNVQTPLHQHYIGLTPQGRLAVGLHAQFQKMRAQAKANPTIKSWLRHGRQMIDRLRRPQSPSE